MVEVVCTPQSPAGFTSLIRILNALDYSLVSRNRAEADLVIAWHDHTFPKYGEFPVSRWDIPPINGRCRDISKRRVGEVFASVFGYELSVDPTTYKGRFVEKSNHNAKHDVILRDSPIDNPRGDRVYQRYVDSTSDSGSFMDLRIAVIGAEVPLCWWRIKRGNQMAARFDQKFDFSTPVPTEEVLSSDEVRKILQFCDEMGLDFCELDGAHDRADGRLYIFDANSTPAIRLSGVREGEQSHATKVLSAAFARQFRPRTIHAHVGEPGTSVAKSSPRREDLKSFRSMDRKGADATLISPKPFMPDAAVEALTQTLKSASTYLEYGTGDTCALASQFPNLVSISVQVDKSRAEALEEVFKRPAYHGRFHVLHVDIGPTREWGYPSSDIQVKSWYQYPLGVWKFMADLGVSADAVLIDGRFRRACFLATLIYAMPGTRILFDDYFDRPQYHSVSRFLTPTSAFGRMAEFIRPDNVDINNVLHELFSATMDPR